MAQIAKRYLKEKTKDGTKQTFSINEKRDGGVLGSLVGLKYVERIGNNEYRITSNGLYWIGKNK